MYDSFTAQLAGLDLTGFSVHAAPFNETDFPAEEASEQTLALPRSIRTHTCSH